MVNEYDEIPYMSRPFRQTHPDRLATIAKLFGLNAPLPSTARVLEVGCGEGGNLIPMALTTPGASFFGFDLAASAVTAANARIQQLGLSNVRIECLDLLNFPEDSGEFDYIIAHGFYSWVPDAVRAAFLPFVTRHLAPNGVAFVSFNAYPGSMFRHAWRDGAEFHNSMIGATDPRERVIEACRMLEWMATASPKKNAPWSVIAREASASVQSKGISWISHDDFGREFHPFYFHEVAEAAEGHGLQYISDAVYSDTLPHNLHPGAAEILERLGAQSGILREQYFDFIELRAYREVLFCKGGVPVAREASVQAIRHLHFSSASVPAGNSEGGFFRFHNPLSDATVDVEPRHRAVLDQLKAAWPCSLPFAEIALAEKDRTKVAQLLLDLYGFSLLDAHAQPFRCGSGKEQYPVAFQLARLEAANGINVTTRLHKLVGVDEASARLIARLDGTASREQLAREFDQTDERLRWLGSIGILDPA